MEPSRTRPSADIPQAEVEGEKDAVAEENAPQTPAAEGEEPVAAEAAADVAEEEPEEVQKSLDQYLAERAAAALAVGKKEARQVSAETLEGQAFRREAIDEFFSGKVSLLCYLVPWMRLVFQADDAGSKLLC